MTGEPPWLTTETSTELLRGLRDPRNDAAWNRYVDRYRGVIVRCGRRGGLSEADADDFAQQSLLEFSTAYRDGHYDRDKGGLRAWMFGIVRVQLARFRARGVARDVQAPLLPDDATDFLERQPASDALAAVWEQEWRDAVLRQALAEIAVEVEPNTVRAFERFALQGEPAERVAAELQITINAVYGAKRRILQRLREVLPLLEEAW